MTTVAEDLDAVTAHKSKLCVSHLDGEHGDALWAVDAVPDAEVPSVLGHHHVAAGHPLDVRAEAQQRGLHAALDVVQLELGRGGEDRHWCSSLLSSSAPAEVRESALSPRIRPLYILLSCSCPLKTPRCCNQLC